MGLGAGMSLDYEVEYNNRARVPDHAEIFARWQRDAAAYRDRNEGGRERRTRPRLRHQRAPEVDLFFPTPPATRPLALFIHGATGARSMPRPTATSRPA